MADKFIDTNFNVFMPARIYDTGVAAGSFLRIEARTDSISRISLILWFCRWRIVQNGKIRFLDASSRRKQHAIKDFLTDECIISLREVIPRRKLQITLGNGIEIEVRELIKVYGYHSDMIDIFMGDNPVVSYSPRKMFCKDEERSQ